MASLHRQLGTLGILFTSLVCCTTLGAAQKPSDGGIDLKPTKPPSTDGLISAAKIDDRLPYIDDVTYRQKPDLLLGKVVEIRKSPKGECPSGKPTPEQIAFVGTIDDLELTDASTPEVSKSIIITRSLAQSVDFFGFLSGSLDESHVSSITVSDRVQRVNDKRPSYEAGRRAFKAARPELFADKGLCGLFQVDGYAHKTIVSKLYEKVDKGSQGGVYGLKVGADYFSSDETNELIHRFGLSLSVLHRPKAQGIQPASTPGRRLSPLELNMFSGFLKIQDKR